MVSAVEAKASCANAALVRGYDCDQPDHLNAPLFHVVPPAPPLFHLTCLPQTSAQSRSLSFVPIRSSASQKVMNVSFALCSF